MRSMRLKLGPQKVAKVAKAQAKKSLVEDIEDIRVHIFQN